MNKFQTEFKLTPVGTMPARNSRDIPASYCGVGCETLDRDYFDPAPVFPQLADLGVKWARLQTGWFKCEREPGQYNFAWLDKQVDTLLELGIEPWFNLGYGNNLYTPTAGSTAAEAVGHVPLNSPEALEAWVRYVTALTEHFRDRIQVYEIWNEPDHPNFWCNAPMTGERYAALFTPTATAIRRVKPDARIAAPAMTSGLLDYRGQRYLSEIFKHADPALLDIVSFHMYWYPPDWRYVEEVGKIRALLARIAPHAELWQGEGGYPSEGGGTGAGAHNNFSTDNIQAKWLTRYILCNLGIGIRHVSWFHAIDLLGYREDKATKNPKGLLRAPCGTRKPSFDTYQRLCGMFDATLQPVARRWSSRIDVPTTAHIMHNIKAFHFENETRRCVAYWREGGIEDENAYLHASLWIEGAWNNATLQDPISGTVHAVAGTPEADGTRFDLPLGDYALILNTAPSP
ncbi:MAG: GH39 family glycosyl hydrolase [Kiritimatiellia bacterium]|jgi:hypothetical protein